MIPYYMPQFQPFAENDAWWENLNCARRKALETEASWEFR